MSYRGFSIVVFLVVLLLSLSKVAVSQSEEQTINADSLMLVKNLDESFRKSIYYKGFNPIAIISPIDDFKNSGVVAASAFCQINPGKKYETVFIINSVHKANFDGFSIDIKDSISTLLGKVDLNEDLAIKMVENSEICDYYKPVHNSDTLSSDLIHFLQFYLEQSFSVLPILVGRPSTHSSKELASLLRPFLNDNNLF
ncbi:AmmeMemoRadiSam system protein B, partial [Candidatus Venteria ishoeyi]|uniref:AmmeMemoRadiSam system protein B n=1 Tax=Candidatus Venteria ishoeyi TaxID=1899563 RepID=UPI000CDED4A2